MTSNDLKTERIISSLIGTLWSRDDLERRAGIRRIVEIGSAAGAQLTALLGDLWNDPYPRFPVGMEAEGNDLIDQYREATKEADPQPSLAPHSEALIDRIGNLAINSRLINDLFELIGEIRAQEAMPLLIDIMTSINDRPWKALRMEPEMRILYQIGPPAVSALVDAIEHSADLAANATRRTAGFVIDMGDTVNVELETRLESEVDETEYSDTEAEVRLNANTIVARAAMVLGEIGDSRALPVLEEVLASNDAQSIRSYLETAINKIKEKNKPLADRDPSISPS
jgi:hypothetical protein